MNQSTNGKIPVKYVLYAHYANLEKKDFQRWADGDGDKPAVLDGIAFLVSQFAALRDLLTAPGYEGLVVLFYAPGLTECFLGIEEGQTREELLKEHAALRFAQAVSSYIDGAAACRAPFVAARLTIGPVTSSGWCWRARAAHGPATP